ncbi:MAG: hypothetical protein ACRCT5_09560 [Tannerellaceae bacterium]
MRNPYKVLNLSPDANNSEIARAQIHALRKKEYSIKEITEAQAALRKPSTRLAADFFFPVFEVEECKPIISIIKSKPIDLNLIDRNKYNSLK